MKCENCDCNMIWQSDIDYKNIDKNIKEIWSLWFCSICNKEIKIINKDVI